MKHKYTVTDILNMNPCYPPYDLDHIKKLFNKKKHITPFDIEKMNISKEDKGWVLSRMLPWPKGFILPESVTDLRVDNCPALTELNVPESVTDLRVYNCPNIKS